jgi:(2Fe-2S) ferredoxin
MGMCEQEPIVQVIFGEQAKMTYGKVNADVAAQIMKQHVQGGMPLKDHVLPI